MKKRVLFLVLSVSAIGYAFSPAFADDDPQWKVEKTGSGYDGFSVLYSWPGEGQEPLFCTVHTLVSYGGLGKNEKAGKSEEEFKLENKIHNTGSGWAYFDGKAGLDTVPLRDVEIQYSCLPEDVN